SNPVTGYDGGDCCECTCVDTVEYTCSDHGSRGSSFACVDPSALCVDDDDVTAVRTDDDWSDSTCMLEYASDGYCDLANNTEECGYDGGDCCECTCVATGVFTCGGRGNGGFSCLDPSAPCVDDDDVTTLPTTDDNSDSTTTTSQRCNRNFMSDGDCDLQNNTEECGYDGGDCCECTCVDTREYTCGHRTHGGFSCLDPSAPCVDDDDVTALPDDSLDSTRPTSQGCIPSYISDGDCDRQYNTEDCGYDGGDCCECTCVDTVEYTCSDHGSRGSSFACVDPSALCVDDDDVTAMVTPDDDWSDSTCMLEYASDGYCDLANNTEECGYDGGDCCECTCVATGEFTCGGRGNGGFSCLDPSAPCVDDDDVTTLPTTDDDSDSTTTTSQRCNRNFMSDGDCDLQNNTEECGYDAGDCCECTCVDTREHTCGHRTHGGFSCLDPSAPCVDDDDVT
ncbi:unnamed protein product, partial [Laminaria digitata]